MFYSIKKKMLSWMSTVKISPYPFFIILGGKTDYSINGSHIRLIMKNLQPGDILLSKKNVFLTSLGIPGYWSHVGLYVGNNKVIHVDGDGLHNCDILDFTDADNIAIYRLQSSIENKQKIINLALEKAQKLTTKDIEYDYDFDLSSDKKFFCTELVYHCYFPYVQLLLDEYGLPDYITIQKNFQEILTIFKYKRKDYKINL